MVEGEAITAPLIVPTLCVGMPPVTLRVTPLKQTQSVQSCIPSQSVGMITKATKNPRLSPERGFLLLLQAINAPAKSATCDATAQPRPTAVGRRR
ncbi:hypothetical protein C2U56_17520 [Pseudomonas fluorescens]|nr:hypothetical protein C2U56_17520 [Pseudomonas fluorescens]